MQPYRTKVPDFTVADCGAIVLTGPPEAAEVTQLLHEWREGNRASFDRLFVILYQDLRRLARRVGAEQPGDTLQATVIVNELYIRLLGQPEPRYQNRAHFFALAARAMRQIQIDASRQASAQKRGGALAQVPLETVAIAAPTPGNDILALDAALTELEKFDARKATLLDLRYFVGLEVQELAAVFDLSTETVRRDLRMGEAWLMSHLRADGSCRA